MTTAQNIAQQIERIPEGSTFGYVDFNITKEKLLSCYTTKLSEIITVNT